MRSKMAAGAERAKEPGSLSPSPGPSDEALGLIFEPLERGDGFRHGAIGAPGYGKTYATRIVIAQALERGLVDVALSHDVKGAEAEFHGVELQRVEMPPVDQLEQHRHVVYRGDPYSDELELDPEEVALLGKRLTQRERLGVLLNIGELKNCLTEGGRGWRSPSTLWFSAQGRALRACLTWTVQQPKRCPDEVFDQSTTIAFHHLDRRSANYLGGTLLLDEDMVEILHKLERGEFVLWQQGLEWNRRVYRF